MVELGGDPDLAQEPLAAEHDGQLRPQHLQRHRPVVLEVVGEVYRGHPTRAELALDGVALGERGLQAVQQIGHGAVPLTAGRGGRRPPPTLQ